MFRQRHEAKFAAPMTTVFSELVRALARGRWGSAAWLDDAGQPPRIGCSYLTHRGSLTRRGRVIECLRPVSLSLYESLSDPPCRVRLRLRWRLEPLELGSVVLVDARYELNGPAYLNRRHWRTRLHKHCLDILAALGAGLDARARRAQGKAVEASGQNTGNSNITATKTTSVNGSPNFK